MRKLLFFSIVLFVINCAMAQTVQITTQSADYDMGSTHGDTTVHYTEDVTISATANYGYHFTHWNDGNTENPRRINAGYKEMIFDADADNDGVGNDSNNATSYTITKNGVTITVSNGILGVYNNEKHYRVYKNQTLTVTSTAGNIASIEFTCIADGDAKYGPGCFIASIGDYGHNGGAIGTWTGSASEVVFTASTNQVRVTQIIVKSYDNIENKTYTAYFDKNTYSITTQCDDQQGFVCGPSISKYLDTITLTASANYGYHFVKWSDGNTDNPRSLVLTQDTTLTAEFALNTYTISTQCNYTERGTTSGDVTTTYLDYVTISATANYGYHFSHWDDYNYDNPRKVQVTEDKTYTAYFDKNTYYITKNYDSNQGYVDGYSSGKYLDNITLIAKPNYGYHFVQWSDGVTDNPRTLILTQDTTFTAEFAQTFSGQCGDNLYWSYQNNTLTISGFGEMNDNRPWGLFINEIQHVVLPNGITHIGDGAFSDCTGLIEITIPYTVTSIGDYAFAGCRKLVQVNCYAINPPMAESTSFANYNVYLNVPCDNLQDYQLDMIFGSFKYIQCMGTDSENMPTDDVVVSPGTNDVTITWPTEGNADTYTIVIKKGNEVFCTLTFNAEGQLLNIAFAPGRDGNHPVQYAEQAGKGYRFTVTSLESGTKYSYNIDVKDASNKTIKSHSGEFTTQSTTAVDNVTTNNASIQKIMRDGQLIIIRNGVEYNAVGQEM